MRMWLQGSGCSAPAVRVSQCAERPVSVRSERSRDAALPRTDARQALADLSLSNAREMDILRLPGQDAKLEGESPS